MSVNPYRGDVRLTVDGQARTLRLTLGALAELEHALGADSLVALVERFERAQFTTRDLLALLAAGLRGGGGDLSAEALARADIGGGASAAAQAGAQLLARAFGGGEERPERGPADDG